MGNRVGYRVHMNYWPTDGPSVVDYVCRASQTFSGLRVPHNYHFLGKVYYAHSGSQETFLVRAVGSKCFDGIRASEQSVIMIQSVRALEGPLISIKRNYHA